MSTKSIQKKSDAPGVDLDFEAGTIKIFGESYLEYPGDFYQEIRNLTDEMGSQNLETITVEIFITYFNTASAKCLWDLFEKLEEIKNNGKEVQVVWKYEADDEDSREAGEDFGEDFDLNFSYKSE